ncbi:succinate dehydrogenase cytochrome b subunit [Luteolibacter algae]|uniref:Succinate dehydrogenase cytochrome b subunit n=1 Tax=Luteolibacter algae TaxID=454151 RepID=A0ABW5D6Y6_9BACT
MNALTRSAAAYWQSSIGKKLIVAVTGLIMVLFLAGHLTGNLLIYVGRGAFNEYAEFLHDAGHGALIWVARIGLLVAIVLHVWATILLVRENKAARKYKYECQSTIQASKSSRIMIWSGSTILAFVIFHLLHFTVRVTYNDAELVDPLDPERFDAYGMVIRGFEAGFLNFFVVLFYIIAMTLLCSHLSHGVGSIFQTLGLRSKKSRELIHKISVGFAIVIWAGFISIPLAIFFGIVK